MQQVFRNRYFSLIELVLAIFCGAVWLIQPEWGIWFILIALLPLTLRLFSGQYQFALTDAFVLVFAITTWVGYWAAYDQSTAWSKAWLIMTAVLVYFSLKSQPKDNLAWVSFSLFCVGVGVSLYFFLTHDFVAIPRKLEIVNLLGRWFMSVRPQTAWKPVHPNYVAGMIAVTVPFVYYPIWDFRKRNTRIPVLFLLAVIIGLGLAGLALVMATSRGVVLAIVSGVGAWFLWRLINLSGINRLFTREAAFPILLLLYLCLVVAFLFLGPAQSGSIIADGRYGNGSRSELFQRSVYLAFDYPITGGGLGSFPGLYSRYVLNIPFFYLPNSHNLFLDVAIEQGLLGGVVFLLLYIASLWMVSNSIAKGNQAFNWVLLFSLIIALIHGMVDDYLYNSVGSVFSLFLVSLSANQSRNDNEFVVHGVDHRFISALIIACALLIVFNVKRIRGIWYSNLGAIQLSKVELVGFPDTGWTGKEIVPKLGQADLTLHSALQFDPFNRTANQRLGIISMLRRDFASAVGYLETAHSHASKHRGVIKSLAYCYVWLGYMEKAHPYLLQIPETKEELDVYTWWWGTQGRSDLSENAAVALKALNTGISQP